MAPILTVLAILVGALAASMALKRRSNWIVAVLGGIVVGGILWALAVVGWLFWIANAG